MLVRVRMLEKIGNEKGKIENSIIKKLTKIGIKAIRKRIYNNAKYFRPIQENIQHKLILKVKIRLDFKNIQRVVKLKNSNQQQIKTFNSNKEQV